MSTKWRFALCVGLLAAVAIGVVWSWSASDPAVQVSSNQPVTSTTTPPTSSTLDPTRPTITVYAFGQKQSIPLPPGMPDPASVPPGSETVVNCHVPVGGSGTVSRNQDPRCQSVVAAQNGGELTPEQRAAIDKFLADVGATTTTTRP